MFSFYIVVHFDIFFAYYFESFLFSFITSYLLIIDALEYIMV